MEVTQEQTAALIREAEKLHHRLELSKTVTPDWYEPGMMEYLDQSEGTYDAETGTLLLRFEAHGTRYEGRTEEIERMQVGERIVLWRDSENPYNPNNFRLLTARGRDIGNIPAELCNALAPFYDSGSLIVEDAHASYVEPISKRSRHAKQAILFVELRARVICQTAQ